MATPQASHSHSADVKPARSPLRSREEPAIVQADDGRQGLDRALQIVGRLQTTLEVDKLIVIFAQEIKSSVAYHSISYQHPEQSLEITLGEVARHTCSYRLVVNAQFLGQMVFTRKRKFTQSEGQTLEGLLCSLVYPLRNALLYSEAQRAAFRDPLTGSTIAAP